MNDVFVEHVADSVLKKNNPSKAVREFKEILRKYPDNHRVKLYIAKAYKIMPDHDKALYWLNQIIKQESNLDNDILELYVEELEAVGRFEVARLWLEKSKLDIEEYDISNPVSYKHLLKDTSFIKVKRLSLNSNRADFYPVFYTGGIIFYSNREKQQNNNIDFVNNAEADIFYANLENSEPVDFNGLIGYGYYEGAFTFYNDYSKMYVSKYMSSQNSNIKEQDKLMGLRLFESDVDTSSNELYTLNPLPFNIQGFSFAHPTTSSDGNILIFASNIPGSRGGSDLYIAKKEGGIWMPPENLGDNVNSPFDEYFPHLFQDSILFFTSNKPGGYGKFDVYKTTLKNKNKPVNLGPPINSESDDFSLIVCADGINGYFSTNRDKATKEDIYQFELVTVSIKEFIDRILADSTLDNLNLSYSEGARIAYKPVDKFNTADSTTPENESNATENKDNSQSQLGISLNFKGEETNGDAEEKEGIENLKGQIVIKRGNEIIEAIEVPDIVNISNFFSLRDEINTRIGHIPKIKDVETKVVTEEKDATELGFRVQVAASKERLSEKDLKRKYKGDRPVVMFREEDWYKYHIGEFENYFVANKIKKESGVKDAFIAAYKQDAKLVLMDALRNQYQKEREEYKLLNGEIPADWEVIEEQEIYFDFNSFTESGSESKSLEEIIKVLEQNPSFQLALFAYADYWGSADYNLALSAERGKTVKKYLVNRGIAENRILVKSFGEKFTDDKGSSPQLYNKQVNRTNRKVEFIIYKLE